MRIRLPLQIRWKVLLAMLVIGVTPLAISAWLDTRAIADLGGMLAEQSGRAVSEQTRQSLEQMADNYARLVDRERQLIELLVHLQAREAERVLASKPTIDRRLFFHEEFDRQHSALNLELLPNRYVQTLADGKQVATPVSFESQAFFAPAAVERTLLRNDAARLAELTGLYAQAHRHHSDIIYRQYTVLENGLIGAFPGHGGYPENFDPRKRAWYADQKDTLAFRWSRPHTDVVSKRSLVNATMPIHAKDGAFIGVTGIDIRLTSLLDTLALPSHLSTEGEVLLTFLEQGPNAEDAAIVVVAKSSDEQANVHWQELPDSTPLTLGRAADLASIKRDMRAGQGGYLRTDYEDHDVFCVYRPSGDARSFLFFIVPANAIVDPGIRAAEYALASTKRQIDTLIPLALMIIVGVGLVALIVSKNITEPINELAEAANKVGAGDFDARTEIATGDELEHLGRAFNNMVPQLEAHAEAREALSLASEVQRRLLPATGPAVDGIDVAGFSVYCDQTGGDYYDFIDLSEFGTRRIGIALGDVAGHGVASALMMATVRALLHSAASVPQSPADILHHINQKLVGDAHAGQFMTLFYLVVDLDEQSLEWASAGHDPAVRYNPTTNHFSKLEGHDIPLGIELGWKYDATNVAQLDRGDIVLLGSDGVWDTRNSAGEFFGKPRLRDLIRDTKDESAEDICDAIRAALRDFRGNLPQRDDVTAVVVKYTA